MRDRLFLPETIAEALDTDLATGLRAVADALDSGQLDGKHLGTIAADGGSHDNRILRVSFDLAAPVFERFTNDVTELRRLFPANSSLRLVMRTTGVPRLRSLSLLIPDQSRRTELECYQFFDSDTDLVIIGTSLSTSFSVV